MSPLFLDTGYVIALNSPRVCYHQAAPKNHSENVSVIVFGASIAPIA